MQNITAPVVDNRGLEAEFHLRAQNVDGTIHPMEFEDPNTNAYNVPGGQTFAGEGVHVLQPPFPQCPTVGAVHVPSLQPFLICLTGLQLRHQVRFCPPLLTMYFIRSQGALTELDEMDPGLPNVTRMAFH